MSCQSENSNGQRIIGKKKLPRLSWRNRGRKNPKYPLSLVIMGECVSGDSYAPDLTQSTSLRLFVADPLPRGFGWFGEGFHPICAFHVRFSSGGINS